MLWIVVEVNLAATTRIGLAHRIHRRFTLGVTLGVSYALGAATTDSATLEAGLELAYVWYPLW
ncbi:MAG: hypothetical protein KIT31_04505 [Deltaproteobacteria bacterium]|nr:hypothetical protein [Deltaproteobacteria bacterium]